MLVCKNYYIHTLLFSAAVARVDARSRYICLSNAAAAEDVERALGDATLVVYAQAGEAFCQSEYAKAPDELVRVVPACGHFFHAACDADRWIRTRRTCQLGRALAARAAAVVVVA